MTKQKILLLGPCHKLNLRTGQLYEPFCIKSRSGKFLREAVAAAQLDQNFVVEYANLLPGAYMGADGRECYPNVLVLGKHIRETNFYQKHRRTIFVALSKIVSATLINEASRARLLEKVQIIALPHPSFLIRRPLDERIAFSANLKAIRTAPRKTPESPRSAE